MAWSDASSATNDSLMGLDNNMLRERIIRCWPYLVKNLKVWDLVMKPCLRGVLPNSEAIMRLERQDQISEAAELFLEAILDSKKPYKWDKFKKALVEPQYALIVDILKRGVTPELKEHDQLQKKLDKFMKDITQTIDPFIACTRLQQEELLSEAEVQKVMACQKQDSDSHANYLILLYVPRNKSWYHKFLKTLWKMNHFQLVKRIDVNVYTELQDTGETADQPIFESSCVSSQAIGCDNLNRITHTQVKIATEIVMQKSEYSGPVTRSRTRLTQCNVKENNLKQLMPSPLKTSEPLFGSSSNEQPRSSSPKQLGFTSKNLQQLTTRCDRGVPSIEPTCKTQKATTQSKSDYSSCQNDRSASNYSQESNSSCTDDSQQNIQCDICKKICKNEKGLKIHKSKMHQPENMNYTQSQERNENIPVQNYAMAKTKNGKPVAEMSKTISDQQRSIGAGVCGQETNRRGPVHSVASDRVTTKQRLQSSDEINFICNVCGRPFSTEVGMKVHRTKMHH